MGGDALERKDRTERTDVSQSGSKAKRDVDAAYIKRTNSHAFELNLSAPARAIIAELNTEARARKAREAELAETEPEATQKPKAALPPPSAPAQNVAEDAEEPTETAEQPLPPTILESFGPAGEGAQQFLRDFFGGGGEKMRHYQDKVGRLVDSMNGGQHMRALDRYTQMNSAEEGKTVFSMEATNGSRMRLYMTEADQGMRLTVTYLNRETGSYDLDMVKQPNAARTENSPPPPPPEALPADGNLPADQQPLSDDLGASPQNAGPMTVDAHEVGRRIAGNGRLISEPEYDARESFSFK